MVLMIKLITSRDPFVFATFEIEMKDGSVVEACAVFERVEKVKVLYRHWDTRELRPFYEVSDVIYEGSECTPNPKSEDSYLYQFHAEVDDVHKIKKHAKLIVVYDDGSKEEICGEYAGITVYYVYYRAFIDVNTENIRSVSLVSMGFRPCVG